MTLRRLILCVLCLFALAEVAVASAQTYPQRVTGADGTTYLRLGPRTYGNYVGPNTPGLGASGSGLDAYGRPIYRGVTGGNTTNRTGTQNPYGRGSYGVTQAQQDAVRSDANRQAELNRFLQERARIQAQRDAYLQGLRR